MRRIALVFPGQGSQKVGMGRAWAVASPVVRQTFEEADAVLGMELARLCWEGPESELNLTANTQPALLTVSVAIFRALQPGGTAGAAPAMRAAGEVGAAVDSAAFAAATAGVSLPPPVAMAGHSLGEYAALVAAGALDFAAALRLVRRRGELMQQAVPVGEGAMAAVIGLEAAAVAAIAADSAQGEVCTIANLNGPGQTVIAGHRQAIERAVDLARQRGARKATLLPVSAPFHSPLMRPARLGMAELLEKTTFHDLAVPVVSNVDAAPLTSGAAARDALIRQIDSPVRWVESIEWMAAQGGAEVFVEVGPGNVLSGLNRRIAAGVQAASVSDPQLAARLVEGWQRSELTAERAAAPSTESR